MQNGNHANRIINNKIREDAMRDLSTVLTKWMMEMGMFTTCLNCCSWDHDKDGCNKFKMKPPATVIVNGCEHHSDIPF